MVFLSSPRFCASIADWLSTNNRNRFAVLADEPLQSATVQAPGNASAPEFNNSSGLGSLRAVAGGDINSAIPSKGDGEVLRLTAFAGYTPFKRLIGAFAENSRGKVTSRRSSQSSPTSRLHVSDTKVSAGIRAAHAHRLAAVPGEA